MEAVRVRRDPAVVDEPKVVVARVGEQPGGLVGVDVAREEMRDLAITREGQVRIEAAPVVAQQQVRRTDSAI